MSPGVFPAFNVKVGLKSVFPSAKLCVAVTYRPPDASAASFSKMMDCFARVIENYKPSDNDLFVSGDFNLPQIDWDTYQIRSGGTSESNSAAKCLLNFMSSHLLSQMVTEPTRGNSILDPIMCNDDRLISDVSCEGTELSDHSMVKALMSFNPGI